MGFDKILGSGENVNEEVAVQTPLIQEILENLMGKVSGASATSDDILYGKSAYVGQELVRGGVKLLERIADSNIGALPYGFYYGSAVVLNNEIHIMGGSVISVKHYKWDGSSWSSVSTLPYNFRHGSAVVYKNEIHILGGSASGNQLNHYKWNGSSWTSVSTLPYIFSDGSAVVLNNEIHIMGGSSSQPKHLKWRDSFWSNVSTLPYEFYSGSAVVFNNEIHILGGSSSQLKHYELQGLVYKKEIVEV